MQPNLPHLATVTRDDLVFALIVLGVVCAALFILDHIRR